MNHLGYSGLEYECKDRTFTTRADNLPPDAVDEACFTDEYKVNPNSHSCGGEPYHEDFFSFSESNGYFTKRHKVLFNLYAFDALRSTN